MKNYSIKIYIAILLILAKFTNLDAQKYFDFEDLPIDSGQYINGSNGFKEYKKTGDYATIKMNTQYDTLYKYWSGGWAYSRVYDSTTKLGTFDQIYASKAYKGANGSKTYAVGTQGSGIKFENINYAILTKISLMFSNSTYAYNSMKFGDVFSKKFGGISGTDKDFFVIKVYYYENKKRIDSTSAYLAYFSPPYKGISSDWVEMLNYTNYFFQKPDSISFHLTSSDVGSFGMNTPPYFTIDNIAICPHSNIKINKPTNSISIIPNPALTKCLINSELEIKEFYLLNSVGQKIILPNQSTHKQILLNTSNLAKGIYTAVVRTETGINTSKLIIQQ